METELVFIYEPEDGVEWALAPEGGDEFEEGVFTLADNCVVDGFGVERGLGIDGGEIAAPCNGDVWAQAAHLATDFHSRDHLRAWHDGDAEQFHVMFVDEIDDGCERAIVDIAIDNFVLFDAFEHSCERQYGKRQTAAARLHCTGMEEDNQPFSSAVRTKCNST